jgi:hypothetical protein
MDVWQYCSFALRNSSEEPEKTALAGNKPRCWAIANPPRDP